MKRPWIRLYTDVPNNPKVQRLPGELFKFWINCLCLAAEDGSLPTDLDISFVTRLKPSQVRASIEKLVSAGLIDANNSVAGAFDIHAWDEHQFASDMSNERVKKHRERRRNVTPTVTETPPEQSRAEQIQSRTEPTPTPSRERSDETWRVCGWTGPEEFESWWVDLVKRHPNRNRNAVARTRAIELVMDRLLIKSEFEAGYTAHQQANGERWTQDNGHFAPNLYSFMDDRMWKLTPIIAPKAPRTLGDIERERILRA